MNVLRHWNKWFLLGKNLSPSRKGYVVGGHNVIQQEDCPILCVVIVQEPYRKRERWESQSLKKFLR